MRITDTFLFGLLFTGGRGHTSGTGMNRVSPFYKGCTPRINPVERLYRRLMARTRPLVSRTKHLSGISGVVEEVLE